MQRRAATALHLALCVVGAALYFVFILPRWWVLTGDIPTTLATVGRIAAGVPIALAAVPVVLNLRHSLKPEFGIPELALRLRAWSAVLHVVAGVLIILTAIVEIWLDLYAAGPWLFAVYGAAASIAVLAVVAFYLSRIAEKPPAEPKASENETAENDTAGDDTAEHDTAGDDTAGDDTAGNEKTPPAKRMKRRLGKRSRKVSETTAVEETTEAPAEVSEEEPAPVQVSITDTAEAEIPVVEDDITGADSGADNSGVADADGADPPAAAPSDEETPPAAGLRNKRPTGKSRHRLPR
jgi:hypothetical protein